jgi:molecular chaperone GrpE
MAKKNKTNEDVEKKEKNENPESEKNNKEVKEKEKKTDSQDTVDKDKKNNDAVEESKSEELYEKRIEEINNKLLRLQADFLNYKTRTEKEKIKYYNDAIEDIVCEMLPILDNFERALENKKADENLFKGVEMIFNQFKNMLKKFGVEEIEAEGKKFDPKLHHGVTTEESDKDEEVVLEVFQKGYKLKDKVIRPSMVKISK